MFLTDGRVCLSNKAAERALRGIAAGRHNWTFAGSDRGGERAAAIDTLIETCKMNGAAQGQAVHCGHPASRIAELLPWNWQKPTALAHAA